MATVPTVLNRSLASAWWLFVFACLAIALADPRTVLNVDAGVYGATGGGIVAAIAAARSGAGSVALLGVHPVHIGGMTTGGLQHADSANASIIGGITREFFNRVEQSYPGRPTDPDYPPGHLTGWLYEAHVAEEVLEAMLQEANVTVLRGVKGIGHVDTATHEADGSHSVTSVATLDGSRTSARVWVDASYEGDLAFFAGASMTWGREAQTTYNETGAGRQPGSNMGADISPYWNASAPNPQVLPHISADVPAPFGAADRWIETYTFRLCMTNSPQHRVPVPKPSSYNASEWELWRRLYSRRPPRNLAEAGLNCLGPIPNRYPNCSASYAAGADSHAGDAPSGDWAWWKEQCIKCDMIGALTSPSTDMVGGSWAYPNASFSDRQAIRQAHIDYVHGLLWFWATDEAVPAAVREEMASFGFCDDEWKDSEAEPAYWPFQLYVREARRLVGDWVWTEHDPDASRSNRSVAMGSYSFDCHEVSRVVHRTGQPQQDYAVDEGRVNLPDPGVKQAPFVAPFDAMLPRRAELRNVLVPVALSASHIRFNAIRMEPTWQVLGHAAGAAAAQALQEQPDAPVVQDIDVGTLQRTLLEQKQVIGL